MNSALYRPTKITDELNIPKGTHTDGPSFVAFLVTAWFLCCVGFGIGFAVEAVWTPYNDELVNGER